MTREIGLRQGSVAFVDDNDYEWLCSFSWQLNNHGYAVARVNGRQKYMHRIIVNAPAHVEVDHIDNNPLNNTRDNIRLASRSQNMMNQGPRRNGSSRYKGVSWNKGHARWVARIRADGKHLFLGYFEDEVAAALAYDQAAQMYFGAFARPNIGY